MTSRATARPTRPFARPAEALRPGCSRTTARDRRAARRSTRATNVEIVCLERPGAAAPLRPEAAILVLHRAGNGRRSRRRHRGPALARSRDGARATWRDARRRPEATRSSVRASGFSSTRREVFAATPIERRKRRVDQVAKIVLAVVTASLVLPLVGILAYLVVKAWPVLSWRSSSRTRRTT